MNTQKEMYGQTEKQVIDAWLEVRPFYRKNPELYIAGILSDAQLMIESEEYETARKFINKAKLLLFKKIK
jgi:hypothetical protein|tara:strand:- start:1152 stop:1361 length:210 start_codon:yes stop_codon:yes gene_type:complete